MDKNTSDRMTEGEIERLINVIDEGKNSEYWNYIKNQLTEWVNDEKRYLDSFKKSGISKDSVNDYNRAIDRMIYLNKFLSVNEIIISDKRTIFERMKLMAENFFERARSFVDIRR